MSPRIAQIGTSDPHHLVQQLACGGLADRQDQDHGEVDLVERHGDMLRGQVCLHRRQIVNSEPDREADQVRNKASVPHWNR